MRAFVLTCAFGLSLTHLAAAHDAAGPTRMAVTIPAEDLGTALKAFAKQRRLQVLYRTELVRNMRSGGASGDLTADEALAQLLRGTGLTYRYVDERTVTVAPLTAQPPADTRAGSAAMSPMGSSEASTRRTSGGFRLTQAGPAPAETAPTLTSSDPDDEIQAGQLQEVIVTAEKRSENVQTIPKPVEVLSQNALTQAGVHNLQDLDLVSSAIQGYSNAGSPPAIRGISSFAFSIGVQAQTGVVLDDVPQPNFSTLADELSDVERVEVLPGPQSTLSGRNAAGGLINIVTRNPTSTLTGSGTAELTNDRQRRLAGYITGPINDELGFSLSGFWDNWDGPLHNIPTGGWVGGYDRSGIRGKLRFHPTDNFSVLLTAYYTHNNAKTTALTASYTYVDLPSSTLNYFTGPIPLASLLDVTPKPYNHDIDSFYLGDSDSHDVGGSLRLEYDTPIGALTSISSYSRSMSDSITPLVGLSLFPDIPVVQNYTVDSLTEEERLTSPQADSRLQYLAGLIYTDTKIVEPYDRPVIEPVDWGRTSELKSTALYGNATYAVLRDTFLTVGLRVQHDEESYNWLFLDGTAPTSQGSYAYTFPAGEVSLRQAFTPDLSGYITYSNAQTGRAYDLEDSTSASTPAGLHPLASERVQSVETGVKSQWLDHRLTLNASIFDTYYRDYQIQSAYFTGVATLPVIRLFSIGKVETRGAEIDSAFAPTRSLVLNASATLLQASIRSYPNAPCYSGQVVPSSCLVSGGLQGNLAGASMPGASRFKGVISGVYTLRLPSLPFDTLFNVLYRYQSSMNSGLYNDPESRIGGYGVLNLAVGFRVHDDYTVQFFVNNAFDKQYYATLDRDPTVYNPAGVDPASLTATYARDSRRYAGVRLSADF